MARNIAIVIAALLIGLVLVQPIVWDRLVHEVNDARELVHQIRAMGP